MKVCGVEEAGRGPVLGPLVMCGLVADDSKEQQFRRLGAKDSKLLTREQRESLYDKILELADDHMVVYLTPAQIDAAVMSKTTNLNWLEADTSANMINSLRPELAILDCPSPNIAAYTAHIKAQLTSDVQLRAEHKADVKFPIVSAASIIAKVCRDKAIDRLKQELGVELGSGYPADPVTKAFLKEHALDFPGLFRKSWQTYKTATMKQQPTLGEF